MTAVTDAASILLAVAKRLAAEAAVRPSPLLPPLLYLSDPVRSPDPLRVAQTLPAGCGVVLRHYEDRNRTDLAHALAGVCRARGLTFLIGADAALAADVGADGVHWPEALLAKQPARTAGIVTASAHGLEGLRAAAAHRCDAAILSPLFATASHPGRKALGLDRFRALVRAVAIPVVALGGVTASNAATLLGCGAAGIAAISALDP